jgi:hypothetical protein
LRQEAAGVVSESKIGGIDNVPDSELDTVIAKVIEALRKCSTNNQ